MSARGTTRPVGVELGRPLLRLRLGMLVGLIMLSLIAGRLVWLQGFQARAYAADAIAQRTSSVALQAPRGQITDRDGAVLAMSVDARLVYGEPRTIAKAICKNGELGEPVKPCDPASIAEVLAPALGSPVAEVADRLALVPKATGATCSKDELIGCRGYVVLAHGLEPQQATKIRALRLVGIGTAPEPRRILPGADVAANVVGFTDVEGDGAAGIERQLDSVLAGKDGRLTAEVDGGGRIIPNGRTSTVEPRPGRDVRLTLQRDLQFYAQQQLAEQIEAFDAESGSATVMDVRTGQVLALVSMPTFDANDSGSAPAEVRGNRALTEPYEPGSIGKAITTAAVLEAGTLTPQSVLEVPYTYKLSNKVFKDAHKHPTENLTYTGVLVESSNVGTIKAAQTIGGPRLYEMLQRFGIGSRTGIELPETAGQLRPETSWQGSDYGTHPIGQGYSATGLQMALVYATIANDGVRAQPTIVAATADSSGRLVPPPRAEPKRIISPQVAAQLRGMLEGVTNDGGTATDAGIEGYRVAGKTGTAQRVVDRRYDGSYTASFVGFAPADRPQIVVQVSLQNPRKAYYGGVVAGPVFQRIMSFALRSQDVPPTGSVSPVLKLRAD